MGLLGGLAFSIFYVTVGIPIAWVADNANRRNIISLAVGTWSVMTVFCGAAGGFLSLFLARVGVGVGEAGAAPPTQSLIADYVPPQRRGSVMAILGLNLAIGVLLGFLFGGWVGQYFGWRVAFYVVGIPGVILALLVRFTLREPPRGHSESLDAREKRPSVWASLKYFMKRPTFRHMPLAAALFTVAAWAQLAWMPAFFIRVHGLHSGIVGTWLGIIYGVFGALSVLLGGFLADKLAAKKGDDRWYPWVSGIATALGMPVAPFVFMTAGATPALIALCFLVLFSQTWIGPVNAMIAGVAGLRRRALASSMFYFLINLVSYGFGPLIIGMANDYFAPRYGNDSMRYSLLALTLIFQAWAAVHFFLAARSVREDLAAAKANALAEDAI